MRLMKKKIPILDSDEAAERFVQTADLTQYDLAHFKPVRFEFERKCRASQHAPAPDSPPRRDHLPVPAFLYQTQIGRTTWSTTSSAASSTFSTSTPISPTGARRRIERRSGELLSEGRRFRSFHATEQFCTNGRSIRCQVDGHEPDVMPLDDCSLLDALPHGRMQE